MTGFVAAVHAGINPIPVDTATKAAVVKWGGFQHQRVELLQAQEWDEAGHGIAWICGDISGRLMCLDFEAGFMDRLKDLAVALRDVELEATFQSWVDGYSESTPRGGMHVLVRLEGDGPCPRNDKFAFDGGGRVLVESRGEGGYVIVAPSANGDAGWVLLRGGVDQIVYCTLEEWLAVLAVIRSFDLTPDAPPASDASAPAVSAGTGSILRLDDESWIDAIKATLPSIPELLLPRGWQRTGSTDSFGEHWTRPGKDPRLGASANLSFDGYLHVHSTNAGLPVGVGLDAVDLLWCWETGSRHAPTLGERTVWLGAQRPPWSGDAGAARAAEPVAAAVSVHLEDWFWEAIPLLEQIRDASVGRGLSPDGVFGTWASGYAATIPMGIWVAGPPARAPLNIYTCLVGASGTGKTGSMRVASDLLGYNPALNPHVLLGRGLRSGEGLCKLAYIPAKKGDDGPPSYQNAIQVAFDEGGVMGKQSERAGSTMIPMLNTAWSGSGIVGGAKADSIVEFPADLVRICAVLGVQYGAAANLFEGEAAKLGFPQRLLYFSLQHSGLADAEVDNQASEPAQALELPFWEHSEYTRTPRYIEFPPDIERQVRLWTRNKDHGDGIDDPLDAHRMNLTKRVAAILMLAQGRGTPEHLEWDLASHVADISGKMRRRLIASLGETAMQRTRARVNEAVMTADAVEDQWLRRRATRLARLVHTSEEPTSMKTFRKRLAGYEKPRIHEIIDYAVTANWIIHKDERFYPGTSQPA